MNLIFLALASALVIAPTIILASAISIDLTLRIDRMYSPSAIVFDGTGALFTGDLDFADDVWGFRLPLMDHSVGDLISFGATINRNLGADYGSGPQGVARNCKIGSFDCSTNLRGIHYQSFAYVDGDGFSLSQAHGSMNAIRGSTQVGETISMTYCNAYRCSYSTKTGVSMFSDDTKYHFTIVSSDIAPIPLPSSSLLLITGLLGLRTIIFRSFTVD